MTPDRGMIVLMGSGELTATMVEVHKEILSRLGERPKAVFLDTPAGFQLNADELSHRAVDYFRSRVQHPMTVASFKAQDISPLDTEEACRILRGADYVLVGPGSPTYAVKQWRDSPVPDIIARMIERGGCLVAASAASLTMGAFTLPVYEIYKVGTDLFWAEGIDILGRFGLSYVVVPHWNNAEGGTHDTRCCFIGQERFRQLEAELSPEIGTLGLDEHTACIIDFGRQEIDIRGIGTVVLRKGGSEQVLQHGEQLPLSILYGEIFPAEAAGQHAPPPSIDEKRERPESAFWQRVHDIDATFRGGLESEPKDAMNALLALDGTIWKAHQDLDDPDSIIQARDLFREMIVLLGTRLASMPGSREACLSPLLDQLIELRSSFRSNRQWKEADAIRDCLGRAGIVIEDGEEGPQWHLTR